MAEDPRFAAILDRTITPELYQTILKSWLRHVTNEEKLFVPHSDAQYEAAMTEMLAVKRFSSVGSRVHPFAGTAYATSKAALAALTREMAADFGPLGIRVNAIAPGEIDTAILSPGTEKIVETIPLRRLGSPEEVAKAIYYLCTEQSSYVTGAELHINGGQHV